MVEQNSGRMRLTPLVEVLIARLTGVRLMTRQHPRLTYPK